MATPSVSATPQARYEKTAIPVATAEEIIETTRQNIFKHVARGSTYSSELSNEKKATVGRITPLYPVNSQDTYIRMGTVNITAKTDATASYAWSITNIEAVGFIVNGSKIDAFGTGNVEAFRPDQNPDVDKAWLSEKSVSFTLSREKESCSIGVTVMTEDPNPAQGSVSENCSFLNGAQALALAQEIAQQIK